VVKALFDTNILIDHLNGSPQARAELQRYDGAAISIITWMEVMAGTTPGVDQSVRAFLATFSIVPIDGGVADRAVMLRRAHRMRLPDAIIWASAQVHGVLLVTRNTRDFPEGEPSVRVPYRL